MNTDYSKCWVCREKDQTANMIMPCKCDRWVHRSCLNRKRISDPAYFDHCPDCGTDYNLEVRELSVCRACTQIALSIIADLAIFASSFALLSYLIGLAMLKLGVAQDTSHPALNGVLVLFGVIGFAAVIFMIVTVARRPGAVLDFPLLNSDGGGEGALVALVVIGFVIVVAGTFYWVFDTAKKRYQRHKRAVDVKRYVVTDYLRGINNV